MFAEVKCPDNDQKVKPKHGKAECVETASSTVCYTVCTVKGYSPEQNIFTVCNDNGQWSAKLPDCIGKDKERLLDIFLVNIPIKGAFFFKVQPYFFIKSTHLHKHRTEILYTHYVCFDFSFIVCF